MTRYAARWVKVVGGCVAIAAAWERLRTRGTQDFVIEVLYAQRAV